MFSIMLKNMLFAKRTQFNEVIILNIINKFILHRINMNVANTLGSYDAYVWGNIESRPDNWRAYISVSLAF